MSGKPKFSDVLDSYETQAGEGHCTEDWLDYFHVTVKSYFEHCEKNGQRATISGLKQEIHKTAKSGTFKFE